MFIYIKHGDNNQFLVNTNCPTVVLMGYIKTKLGLANSELIDLCDKQGVLKFLFLPQNSQESACALLKPRESFIVCSIQRTSDGAYKSATSLLSGVDPAVTETLQTQIDDFEKARKQLHIVEATPEEISAPALSTKTTKKRKKVTHANAPDESSATQGTSKAGIEQRP